MDAAAVFRELIGRDRISTHVAGIGVAMGARVCHVNRVHRRAGVAGSSHVMNAVAIGAHGYFGITSRQALAVYAGVVLGELVRAQAGVKLPDESRIGVATAAQLRYLLAPNFALPPSFRVHRLIGLIARGIAAVATDARQTFLGVNVLTKLLLRNAERVGQGGMTIKAGILGLPIAQGCRQHDAG